MCAMTRATCPSLVTPLTRRRSIAAVAVEGMAFTAWLPVCPLAMPRMLSDGRLIISASLLPLPSCTASPNRSEEHTSELQSHLNLVCRLLLEKKKKNWLNVMGSPCPPYSAGADSPSQPPSATCLKASLKPFRDPTLSSSGRVQHSR